MTRGKLNSTDALSGILFCVIGLGFMIGGRSLPLGTASRMGPGWFPMAVSGCLLLVGLVILVRAFLRANPEAPAFIWRPLVLIAAALAIFALALKPLGLALAITFSAIVSSYAHPPVQLKRVVPYAVLLAVACCVVFVKWLGLQMPIVGVWLVPFLGRW